MNYSYDICLNLNKKLYDFFDWNKNDKYLYIKLAPIYKVCDETFTDLITHNIKLCKEFYNTIYNKAKDFNNNSKNIVLFRNESNIIAINFDKKGNSIQKSCISLNEEFEILEETNNILETKIEYEIIKKDKTNFKTRNQIKLENFIYDELKNIKSNRLNYIYLECFGKKEYNKEKIINEINSINQNSVLYKKLYDILKITSKTK